VRDSHCDRVVSTMLRPSIVRPIYRSFAKASSTNIPVTSTRRIERLVSQVHVLSGRRPRVSSLSPIALSTTSLLRYATKGGPPFDKIDAKAEKEVLEKIIQPDPASVSSDSSVRQVFEYSQNKEASEVQGGIRGDFDTIKDTFALTHVPREAYLIGGAGVLPYLATSLSTVYLAWDINVAHATGSGYLLSAETAHQILDYVTPLQIGYGAVIISFLGAIHWGLEFAGYGGHHSYRRYAIGVLAPAVAWPTMLMPVEHALITQFLAFTILYFIDARATTRGWCPPWYSTYRFVLTFVVGASIVASLVGRGQIAEKDQKIAGPVDKMQALRDSQWENLEREERERRQRIAKEEQADKDGDEDKGDKDAGSKKKEGDTKDKREGDGKGKVEKDEDDKANKGGDSKEEKGDKGGEKEKKGGKGK